MNKKRTRDAVERAPEQASTPDAAPDDLQECIRRRAYERWEQGGGAHGGHEDDWLQAEREILAERAAG